MSDGCKQSHGLHPTTPNTCWLATRSSPSAARSYRQRQQRQRLGKATREREMTCKRRPCRLLALSMLMWQEPTHSSTGRAWGTANHSYISMAVCRHLRRNSTSVEQRRGCLWKLSTLFLNTDFRMPRSLSCRSVMPAWSMEFLHFRSVVCPWHPLMLNVSPPAMRAYMRSPTRITGGGS